MRRFEKTYKLMLEGKELGRYTTIAGADAAAARRGITGYTVEPI